MPSANDVDAIMDDAAGGVVHWDGSRWTDASPFTTGDELRAVYGNSSSDIWAVGTRGLKLHFDGKAWSSVGTDTETFTALWGSASNDVWAVSEEGAIEHFDGSSWTLAYRHDEPLGKIWGTAPSSLWISGNGFVGHFDGQHFERTAVDVAPFDRSGTDSGIWASSDRDVWAAGGQLMHYDGTVWEEVTLPDHFPGVQGVWGRSAKDIWVAAGDTLLHFDGSTWQAAPTADILPFIDISDVYAIGGCDDQVWVSDGGRVLLFDGTKWSVSLPSTTNSPVMGLWGVSPDNLVAVGAGTAIIRHAR